MIEGENKSSYEKINYNLRPGKCIERKMLCEALQSLSFIQNLKDFRYIGFGSTHFIDFSLFHRLYGIRDMISIEKDEQRKTRFQFNNPFACIKLNFGDSNAILPELKWDKMTILWLDYDSKLRKIVNNQEKESDMFSDIGTFFNRAMPGSVFIITVDVKPDHPKSIIGGEEIKIISTEEELKVYRFENLVERIGKDKILAEDREINLNIQNNPKIVYNIINNEIQNNINTRNYGLDENEKIQYKQLFNFIYDDGTLMLTVGGIIYNEGQMEALNKMQNIFDNLDFIRSGESPFEIEIPQLTFKEIHLLDSFLPDRIDPDTGDFIQIKEYNRNIPMLTKNDKINYSKIYKYFPTYTETIF